MKKQLLTVIMLFAITTLYKAEAQNPQLWGMAPQGGKDDYGTIFECDTSGNFFSTAYTCYINAAEPRGDVIQVGDSLLYGMTSAGGTNKKGVIFSVNMYTGVETCLHNFGTGTDGSRPFGSLVKASNGLLYGMTSAGGASGWGVLFSYNITTGTDTVLHNFSTLPDGREPHGNLLQVNDSILLGMTLYGGVNDNGNIFSYNISSDSLKVLYSFGSNSDGQQPYGSLIKAYNGLFYGMTYGGGTYTYGTIFSYDYTTNTETDLYNFAGGQTDAYSPYGSLLQTSDSLLYGLCSIGEGGYGGALFSYNISTNTETILYDFGSTSLRGSLVQAKDGQLCGTVLNTLDDGIGTVFSYDISTQTLNSAQTINYYAQDSGSYGSLFVANNGLLYGMAILAGDPVYYDGVIFSYDDSTGVLNSVYNFGTNSNGYQPFGGLIQANNGLLYGLTQLGGKYGLGTIFSYNRATDALTDLHDFGNSIDGQGPYGNLVQAGNGLLYGVTESGGFNNINYNNAGIIFSYNINTGVEQNLYNFNTDSGGYNPTCTLIQASDSLLYGATSNGGLGTGNLFSYSIATGAEKDLYDFGTCCGYYAGQNAGALLQVDGDLYGLSSVIYKYNIATGTVTNLHQFGSGNDGQYPVGALIMASNGLLYGATMNGGTGNDGTIFSYDRATSLETVVYNFKGGTDGQEPGAGPVQAPTGFLYGTTIFSGVYGYGTIYSYNISTGKETIVKSFDNITTGNHPWSNLLVIDTSQTVMGFNQLSTNNTQLSVYPNPSSDYIHTSIQLNQPANLQLRLVNMLGQTVWVTNAGTVSNYQNNISVANLPDGVYLLEMVTGGGMESKEVVITN